MAAEASDEEARVGDQGGGIRARGEEALGELAQALLENPLFSQALGKALGAGERAAQAQKSAMGALDVASAGDVERLSRRLRSVSDRLEALEDSIDSIATDVSAIRRRLADTPTGRD